MTRACYLVCILGTIACPRVDSDEEWPRLGHGARQHPSQSSAVSASPGSSADSLQTSDSTVSATIPVTGGVVELPGFAKVIFPAGAFDAPREVTVEATAE